MVISTVSLKGGSGKTTIAINVAVQLACLKYRVAVIDADPNNQNAIKWSGFRPDELPTILTVSIPEAEALRKNIFRIKEEYDYVIIDGTPALAELTGVIMLLSDLVILPLKSSCWDVWAFADKFLPKFRDVKSLKPDLEFRILRNAVQKRKLISREVIKLLDEYDLPIFKTAVGDRTSFEFTPMQGIGVVESVDKNAAFEIEQLTQEIIKVLTEKIELCH